MSPTKGSAGKSSSGKKGPKEKVFHPESRKAGQLERKLLRKHKLVKAAVTKSHKQLEQIDRNVFFLHALPAEALALTLSELHDIMREAWLTRFDHLIEAEQAARRKGRPKSTKEDKYLDQKKKDTEEYRTGIELPDLTYPPNVALFRKWNADDPGFLHLLRWIRISSERLQEIIVSKPGARKALLNAAADAGLSMDPEQQADDQVATETFGVSGLLMETESNSSDDVEHTLAQGLENLL